MIYLACFALSTLFAFWANKTDKRWKFWLFSVLCIALPVLLAGLRGFNIGIDTENYLTFERFWAGAMKADSLIGYLQYYLSLGLREPLFALFIGSIARLTGEYRVFLFLAHLIIMTGIYIGAVRMKHRARPELVLLLFYLMYFNNSLNIIRQYMAMALIFAFFADLEQRKFVRYSIVVLIVSLIHTTALIAFIPLVIYLILYPRESIVDPSRISRICSYASILVGVVCFWPLINLLMQVGILSGKYSFYFSNGFQEFNKTRFALFFLEGIGIALCYKDLKTQFGRLDFYMIMSAMFAALHVLALSLQYGQRIPTYFCFVNIITLSMLANCQHTQKRRLIWHGAIALFCTYYWFHTYVIGLSSGTFPYVFGF